MIVTSGNTPTCMGYATFVEQRATMNEWLDPLERDLSEIEEGGRKRLTKLQHLLLELVQKLDQDQTRYPFKLAKAEVLDRQPKGSRCSSPGVGCPRAWPHAGERWEPLREPARDDAPMTHEGTERDHP